MNTEVQHVFYRASIEVYDQDEYDFVVFDDTELFVSEELAIEALKDLARPSNGEFEELITEVPVYGPA